MFIRPYTRSKEYLNDDDLNILSFSLSLSTSVSHSEKDSLEKLLSGLQQEVDSQRTELEALRGSSLELQRQRDLLRQQREDLEMQLARQRTEAQRGYSKERGRMTVTQYTHPVTRDCSQASCLEFRSVTHVILQSAMHPDDIWMKI